MEQSLSSLTALLVFVATAAGAQDSQTLHYTFISNNKIAGTETDTYLSNGAIDATYEFNDRGRGPKITAHYALTAKGWPSGMDITGVDYLKAPVDEHFSTANDEASWRSSS